jgi:hypothetical protein
LREDVTALVPENRQERPGRVLAIETREENAMATSKIRLYTFWRSQAAYRVRIALHLKGLDFEPHVIDLLKGDQISAYKLIGRWYRR